jgi:hypothetical protein
MTRAYLSGADPGVSKDGAMSTFEYDYLFKQKGPEQDDEFGAVVPLGKQMLDVTITSLENYTIKVRSCEGWLRKDLYPGMVFIGKADVLTQGVRDAYRNYGRTIIDWKTANSMYDQQKVDTDDQLTAYSWLTQGQYDTVAFVVVTKDPIEVQWFFGERTDEQIRLWKEKALNTWRMIREATVFPGRYDWHCDHCEYTPTYCQGKGEW